MIDLLWLWASYVLSAFLWCGLVVAVLGAFTLTLGLCRAASLDDGEAAEMEAGE